MIVDLDRHVGVSQFKDLFPYMTLNWQKHFEREEWVGATNLASSHIQMTEDQLYAVPERYTPSTDNYLSLLLPYQGLTVNGWADKVAGRAFVEALNSYGLENWASDQGRLAVLASPHDPVWSADEIRRRAQEGNAGAVALPLTPEMLGSRFWDPVYQACVDTGLPLVIHFSGVEGNYAGAPALSGGVHRNAFSRMALMPHLAESNITSLAFEGAFARFPRLQILFSGFGFTWLPSLLWRLDREWRTFRHDVPWVKEPPSGWVKANMWFTTWPLGEAADTQTWQASFTEDLFGRIAFGSHAPHGTDSVDEPQRVLGDEWAARLFANGQAYLDSIPVGV
jgi:predicted TIM-barrel fold metal-dependent hydrolase